MKTSKFEEIVRRKLESLKPDFQEQDWNKFQSFQQHVAPSFWQTYGHWLGYAVAVATTAVMVVLYVSQSRQNEALLREMQELKQQVATSGTGFQPVEQAGDSTSSVLSGKETGWKPVPHRDTIYVVQPRIVYRDRPIVDESVGEVLLDLEERIDKQVVENPVGSAEENTVREKALQDSSPTINESTSRPEIAKTTQEKETTLNSGNGRITESKTVQPTTSNLGQSRVTQERLPQERLPQDRLELGEIPALPTPLPPEASSRVESRRLLSRMPRPVKKATPVAVAQAENPAREKAVAKNTSSQKKTEEKQQQTEKPEQPTKEESLLPKFGLNLPFRVGVGQQWEGRTKAFSIWNEVLLGEHWAVQTGLSWEKLEDQKFFSERLFKERMKKEFRRDHAPKLPPSFDIFNITAHTRIVRIPLNLTYRNGLGNGFSYFFGAGTNLNVQARQTLSFDFKRPTNDYGQETRERTISFPLINNATALVGVEKRWSPIVFQASSYFNTRFKTFPFLDDRSDVGIQVKLLYEFGPKKK